MGTDTHRDNQFNLRLPEGLRDRLKDIADANSRSLNSEIVARIKASFDTTRTLEPEVARLLDDHINRKVAERLTEIARTIGGGNGKA